MEPLSRLKEIPRLLLVRLRSLGDSILTLPLIEALHRWRPDLGLGIVIEAPFAPVFLHHPAIDEVLVVRTRRGFETAGLTRFGLFVELQKRRYPAVLNLHGGTTSMLLTALTGAGLRLGQESHRGSWIYNGRIPSSTELWRRDTLHTVEHQLSFMRWLGIPINTQSATLHAGSVARSRINGYLKDSGISDYFLVHPTATLRTKQWKAENFAALGDFLFRRYQVPVIYTAAAHELPVLQKVREAAQERHIYRADLGLSEHFALIERCRLFIGNDSGPMHAAAALKKPVVVVWGSSNFNAWHPWDTDFEAVRADLPCMPCPGYECKAFGEPRCILDIPVSRVAEACEKILSRH